MSFAQTTTLPSISHLLNSHPPSPPLPPRLQTTPAFNLSPASPVSSHPSSSPSLISAHSPNSSNNDLLHPLSVCGSSPLLSPVDSCRSPLAANASLSPRSMPAASVSVVDDIPPLQGYDPPVRKCSSSNTLHPPTQVAPWSSRDNINNVNTSCTLHVSPPPPVSPISNTSSSRNNSITSNSSSNMLSLPSPAMSPCQEKKEPNRSMRQQQQQSSTPAPPSTQIIISPTGQPILKRRRGRPPSNREPQQEGGWTFLTPTVWDVKQTATPVIGTTCASSSKGDNTSTTTPCSSANGTLTHENNDMQGSMAAFTSSTMETVLQMPRKKRGRKPKTHIEGNPCFVWRDLPCTRSSSRSSKKIKRSD